MDRVETNEMSDFPDEFFGYICYIIASSIFSMIQ